MHPAFIGKNGHADMSSKGDTNHGTYKLSLLKIHIISLI